MGCMHDPYTDQLAAARYRAERDQARQDMVRLRSELERAWRELEDISGRESDALEWVEEQGGLGEVRDTWDEALNLCATIGCEPSSAETLLWALGECTDIVAARIMPEGMEWPRYEDGNPVGIGSETDALRVDEIRFGVGGPGGCTLYQVGPDGLNDRVQAVAAGERAKRPAPKAYDANGEEIREGDTVYNEVGTAFTMIDVNGKNHSFKATRHYDGQICDGLNPANCTHRAPALAADRGPLREGETVYEVKTGEAFEVMEVYPGTTEPDFPRHTVKCRKIGDVEYVTHMFKPSQLTHERPDSWERLEEDASKQPYGYCVEHGLFIDPYDGGCTTPTNELFARDLVRRAKALSERNE